MSLARLELNLAPRPSLWRQHHQRLGWGLLGLGFALLLLVGGLTARAYWEARRAGREAFQLTEDAKRAARREQQLMATLADVDVAKEAPRWRNAERILQERALPFSRLLSELEQCLPDGVRVKGLQRSRGRDRVQVKLKGEARTREAEVALMEALQAAPVFTQVTLERESERTGGGWDFELALASAGAPGPFQVRKQPEVKQEKPGVQAAMAQPSASPLKPRPTPVRRPR